MEEKIANHACMNERFSSFSYGEKPHRDAAQRNRDVALNNCKKEESLHQQTFLLFPVLYI